MGPAWTDPCQLAYFKKFDDPPPSVCNPSSVPECLSFHLQTFKWRCYRGTIEEKEVVRYILQNARCLKTATIYVSSCRKKKERLKIKELKSMPKASTSCLLVTRRRSSQNLCFSSHSQLQFDDVNPILKFVSRNTFWILNL